MLPLQACIGNMVRRVLKIIREEYISELKNKAEETDPQESLHKILTAEGDQHIDFNLSVPSFKAALIEHINEFEAELETWSVLIVFTRRSVRVYLMFECKLDVFDGKADGKGHASRWGCSTGVEMFKPLNAGQKK